MNHIDAAISSNLSEHPLYSMTPGYRLGAYLRHKLGFGLRDRSGRNRYVEMHQSVEQYINAQREELQSKELFTLKEITEWSKKSLRVKNLPPPAMKLLQ